MEINKAEKLSYSVQEISNYLEKAKNSPNMNDIKEAIKEVATNPVAASISELKTAILHIQDDITELKTAVAQLTTPTTPEESESPESEEPESEQDEPESEDEETGE